MNGSTDALCQTGMAFFFSAHALMAAVASALVFPPTGGPGGGGKPGGKSGGGGGGAPESRLWTACACASPRTAISHSPTEGVISVTTTCSGDTPARSAVAHVKMSLA